MTHLPFDAPLAAYQAQAAEVLAGFKRGDIGSIQFFRHNLPRFLDENISWLPKRISAAEITRTPLEAADAQLAIARWYQFADWERLAEWVTAVADKTSSVSRFESAVEAVIAGDAAVLKELLQQDPNLVRARSTRITPHQPGKHEATLLHYIAANGVEGYRQKSPKNAPEIARMLLKAGAEPDALAGMYGGRCTTMALLVSSTPPAEAGVQVPLVETLLDFGANVNGTGEGKWTSPLLTALAFGFIDAARTLARRGARVEGVAAAAGLGMLAEAKQLLPQASGEDRHRALALAAQLGHTDVVRLLLDAGEDPNRYNPEGNHAHSTPIHQAALAGHLEVVKLLAERGARLDIKDTIWDGTPLGWAEHGGQKAVVEYLRTKV